MIGRLNHVAIAVKDLAAATALYRDTLGARVSQPLPQPEHGVTVVFVELPNTKIELLEPLGADSPDREVPRAQSRRRHPPHLLRGRRHPRRARPAEGAGRPRARLRRAAHRRPWQAGAVPAPEGFPRHAGRAGAGLSQRSDVPISLSSAQPEPGSPRPFSAATVAGGLIFVSGHSAPHDPARGIHRGETPAERGAQCARPRSAEILAEAGSEPRPRRADDDADHRPGRLRRLQRRICEAFPERPAGAPYGALRRADRGARRLFLHRAGREDGRHEHRRRTRRLLRDLVDGALRRAALRRPQPGGDGRCRRRHGAGRARAARACSKKAAITSSDRGGHLRRRLVSSGRRPSDF